MSTLVIDHRDVALDYELECLLIRQKHHPVRSIPLHQHWAFVNVREGRHPIQ